MQALTAADKVARGREAVYDRFVFLAPPTASWKVIVDPTCDTAWTNGPDLGYSPKFVDGLTIADTTDLMLHESGHVILGHHVRMGNRDPELWNKACDLALTDRLGQYMQEGGYIRTHSLTPGVGSYAHLPRGKSAEWYYDALKAVQAQQQAQAQPQPGQQGHGAPQAGPGNPAQADKEPGRHA